MSGLEKRIGWRDVPGYAPEAARILVVEDEKPVRDSLVKLVSRYGYQVRGAASAEEGDSWLSSEDFHLVLLDIELPKMKGVEFLRWTLERSPETAVIMMTGLDDPALAIECLEEGARTYLVKPPEPEFLRLALRDALAVRRILQERNDLAEEGTASLPQL